MLKRTYAHYIAYLLLFFTLLFVACGVPPATTSNAPLTTAANVTVTPAPVLTDMQTPEDLKAQFNQEAGMSRIILLVSPT